MTLQSNQFELQRLKGEVSLSTNQTPLAFNCQVDAGEAGTIVPAQAVVLASSASEQIVVEATTGATADIFGFDGYSVERNEYTAKKNLKVYGSGSVMYMEASTAIARGADLQIVPTGNKVVTATTGTVIGKALDIASGDGDLIRVLVA